MPWDQPKEIAKRQKKKKNYECKTNPEHTAVFEQGPGKGNGQEDLLNVRSHLNPNEPPQLSSWGASVCVLRGRLIIGSLLLYSIMWWAPDLQMSVKSWSFKGLFFSKEKVNRNDHLPDY